MTRVVITGIIAPVGVGREACWQALLAGILGIRPVSSFDTSPFPVHLGGEVPEFDPAAHLRGLNPAVVGRASQFAAAAARMALHDAGFDPEDLDRQRTGVSMGTTSGEPLFVEQFFDQLAHASWEAGGAADTYTAPPGEYLCGEPCFVANPGNYEDAAIITQRFEAASNAVSIILFDAFSVRRGPIATIPLRQRVHPGFHTSFVPLSHGDSL